MKTEFDYEIAPGIRLKIYSAGEALTFLTDELARWNRVQKAETQHPSMRDRALDIQSRRLNKMINQVKTAISNKSGDWAAEVSTLQWFSERQSPSRALCTLIPADAAVLNLIETDPDAAIVGMSARQRGEDTIGMLEPNSRADAILALQRFAIAGAGAAAHKESFSVLYKQIDEALNYWKADISAATTKAKAIIDTAQTASDALDAQKITQAKTHEEMLQEHEKTLKAMEEKFLREMALRGPVQYWKERASSGQTAAWIWLGGFVAAALIIFALVVWQGPGLLSLLKDKNDQISLAAVPLLLAALVPLLWVLRHIARMFADSIADARDASQRSALTSTFLALSTQEKVTFSENERAIITQALFRPSPAQPTDDGVPVPLLELLRR